MNIQKVLIIGFVWPEPNSSAAGTRMMQLISIFTSLNWNVTFASASKDSEFMADLQILGIETASIELNSDSFNTFLKETDPTIVLFDRFMIEEQFGWRVELVCPDALRILDCEDLHCLRQCREKASKKGHQFTVDKLLAEEITKREVASIFRCDLSLIISEFEVQLLLETFKCNQTLLYYLPLFAELEANIPSFEDRTDFVFIGNFLHSPNCDSVI
ncbi:MAG TPA: glycosyltransferase, partial [Flavobacterium sp.]